MSPGPTPGGGQGPLPPTSKPTGFPRMPAPPAGFPGLPFTPAVASSPGPAHSSTDGGPPLSSGGGPPQPQQRCRHVAAVRMGAKSRGGSPPQWPKIPFWALFQKKGVKLQSTFGTKSAVFLLGSAASVLKNDRPGRPFAGLQPACALVLIVAKGGSVSGKHSTCGGHGQKAAVTAGEAKTHFRK